MVSNWQIFGRQYVAKERGGALAVAKATLRLERDHWDGHSPTAARVLIERAVKDCSLCVVCVQSLAAGQSVTLRRYDIGAWSAGREHVQSWVWAPVCLNCTLTRLRPWKAPRQELWQTPWEERPQYEEFRRFRCRGCGRPVRVASSIKVSPCCCAACQQVDRLARNKLRRRVKHQKAKCPVCRKTFVRKRSDAYTCSNRCRQKLFRQEHRP
jgi:hypothetical protein